MPLTQDQLNFFHENGYLVIGKILGDAEVETLRAEYDREFERAESGGHFRNLSADATADHAAQKAAPERMLQIIQMSERNIHFMRLLYDPRILDIAEDLLGPNLMLFHDQALFKPERTGGAIAWHQDNMYWKCKPANMASCWLTLDDAFLENGAMQVIPGSHLKPESYEPIPGKILVDAAGRVDESKRVVIDLPAGGIMFHHCQTLHHTEPNTTTKQRRAFAIHFMAPGTRDAKGEVMRVGFNHPMLRASL
jgi:ectoine hydroxylase-related dioxygenase (phytanoyl-CoA dioxygenase family)